MNLIESDNIVKINIYPLPPRLYPTCIRNMRISPNLSNYRPLKFCDINIAQCFHWTGQLLYHLITTDRLVNLGRMTIHPKRPTSISDISGLNAFISSGPRKLNYCRLEKRGYFYYFFLFYTKFLYLLSAFFWLFLTLKINLETTCSLLQIN